MQPSAGAPQLRRRLQLGRRRQQRRLLQVHLLVELLRRLWEFAPLRYHHPSLQHRKPLLRQSQAIIGISVCEAFSLLW